ncbi:MAG: DUF3987 domain-containing protein [Patescibacteria group bacterium]
MEITLPAYAKNILDNYLIPLNPGAQLEMLLLALNVYCSRILCHNRVKIHGFYPKPIYPNIYGITFAISGSGKDRVLSYLDDCYADVWQKHNEQFIELRKGLISKLEQRAQQLSDEMKTGNTGGWSKKKMEDYVERYSPREIQEEMSSATPEGVVALREALGAIEVGSLHFSNSEFIDYIMNTTSTGEDILAILKDCYEHGDSGSKITKGNKLVNIVKDVPQTMLVFSSISGLIEDGKTSKQLDDFFCRGMARRSLVCFPKSKKHNTDITFEEYNNKKKIAEAIKCKITELFNEVHRKTADNMLEGGAKIIISDETLKRYIFEYEKHTEQMSDKVPVEEAEPFKSVTEALPRKVIRLAGIITMMRGQTLVDGGYPMSIEDFEMAREQVEFYFEQFSAFYKRVAISDVEKVMAFFLKEQNKIEITKTTLRKQRFTKVRPEQFSRWLDNLLEKEMPEYCAINKKMLVELKGRNYIYYRIEDIVEVENKKEAGELPEVKLSINKTDDKHSASGWEVASTTFDKLPELIKQYPYACHSYNTGYRNGANVIRSGNLLILDIDNDNPDKQLYIEQGRELVKDFHHIIIPTRHHRLPKNGKPSSDRYRIILLCETPIIPQNDYKEVIKKCIESLGLLDYVDVPVTADCARYFYPSPAKSTFEVNTGKYFFNWSAFDVKNNVAKKYIPTKEYNLMGDVRRIPLSELAEKVGAQFTKKSGHNIYYSCPFHTSVSGTSFRIEEKKNLWICTQCEVGGSPIDFIMKHKNVDCYFAINILKNYLVTKEL